MSDTPINHNPTPKRWGFKGFLFAGLAAILPTLLVALIVVKGFDLVHGLGGGAVTGLLFSAAPPALWMRLVGDLLVLFLLTALVLGAGLLVHSVFGRHIISWGEQGLLRLPLVKQIYPALKQLTDFLVSDKRPKEFQRVVAVPYPHPGVYSIGFVTGDGIAEVDKAAGKRLLTVFIPSSPAPFTGWICLVPESEAIHLQMTVEEALRLCVSLGVSRPASINPSRPA